MPTYRNDTDKILTYAGVIFEPGISVASKVYVPYPELTFISDDPLPASPILFSGQVADSTVDIPPAGAFLISVIADTDAVVKFSTADAGITLKTGEAYELLTHWGKVRRVEVSGAARVVVEERGK